MKVLVIVILVYLSFGKTETVVSWGEKEYSILEPASSDYTKLSMIVYADRQEYTVTTTNGESDAAIQRSDNNVEETT
jgi:hypothetical protein